MAVSPLQTANGAESTVEVMETSSGFLRLCLNDMKTSIYLSCSEDSLIVSPVYAERIWSNFYWLALQSNFHQRNPSRPIQPIFYIFPLNIQIIIDQL